MGKLATAGMISGLGQGLEKGLNTMQGLMGQSMLQEERNKMELQRLQLTEQYASEREARGYAHSEALAKGQQAHAERLQDRGFTHAEAMTGQQISSAESIAAGNRESSERIHKDEGESRERTEQMKDKTEQRKVAATEQHYKDWKEVYSKIASGKGTAHDFKQAEIYERFLTEQSKAIRDQLKDPLADPKEKERLQAQLEGLDVDLREVLGMKQRAKQPSTEIVDPFKQKQAPGEAAAMPPPGGMIQTPAKPAQKTNVIREGKAKIAEAKAALESAKANASTDPALIQRLEQTVRELEARWGSAGKGE